MTADRLAVKGTLLALSMLVIFGGAIMAPTPPATRAQFADIENIDFRGEARRSAFPHPRG